ERRLDVFGVYVEAGGGDDGLLLPATEVDVPILVHLSEVARGEPAAFGEWAGRAVAPVAGRDVRAAHENLAALAELQLLAGQNLPDRASPRLEGVVDRDERRGLRHAVALYDREAEATPERLAPGVERRPARDEGPELPAEVTVDASERPEPLERVRAFGGGKLPAQLFAAATRGLPPLDVLAQRFEHAR